MKINFKQLTLKNFMSFKEAVLDLDDSGFSYIQGINECGVDNASSNGSGKSSLFEALVWCLTGDTIRGNKTVERIGSDSTSVELLFKVDANEYKIIRTKNPSNLFLFKNEKNIGGKGIRDTEKILEETLPDLNASLLGSVVVLGQGLPLRFSNNTPSGRKDVLEKLFKTDFMIENIRGAVNNRKNELSEQHSVLKSTLDNYMGRKDMMVQEKETLDNRLKEYSEDEYDAWGKRQGPCAEELSNVSDTVDYIIKSIDGLKQRKEEVEASIDEMNHQYQEDQFRIEKDFADKIHALEVVKAQKEAEKTSIENEIAKLKSVVDICPTCNQKLPGVFKPDTADLENRLVALVTEISEVDIQIQKLAEDKTVALNACKAEFEVKVAGVREENDYITPLKENEETLKELLETQKELEKENKELIDKMNYYNNNVSLIQEQLNGMEDKLNKLNFDIEATERELEDVKLHEDVISKISTQVTRNFRGHLLYNVIQFINSIIKLYSKEFFSGGNLEIKIDGNDIDIYYNSREYECLSGGERQKVDIIVQMAIREALCSTMNFSSNILVLDEITDNLDALGAEKVINFIASKLSGINSVYIISHHKDYSIPYDKILTVKKDGKGVSSIV